LVPDDELSLDFWIEVDELPTDSDAALEAELAAWAVTPARHNANAPARGMTFLIRCCIVDSRLKGEANAIKLVRSK
jgi:hypothetical protein